MSNVYNRLRKESPLQVENLAREIQGEATRFVWNTNNIPKGWRDVFAKPMCNLTMQLLHHIRAANSIWCTDEMKAQQRKEECRMALLVLQDMLDMITYMGNTLPINWNKFDALLTLIEEEQQKIRDWRDSVKVSNN